MSFFLFCKDLLKQKKYKIVNIDAFISCEKPKLKGFLEEMKEKISENLGIEVEQISLKAGTNEGVGPVGKMEAIEAYSIVLIDEVM